MAVLGPPRQRWIVGPPLHAPGAGHIERPLPQGEPTGQRAPQREDEERGSVAGRERHRRRPPTAGSSGGRVHPQMMQNALATAYGRTPRPTANLAQELARSADAVAMGPTRIVDATFATRTPNLARCLEVRPERLCRCTQTWPSPR